MSIPHLPALRAGVPYRSLDTIRLTDVRDRSPVVEVSQVNPGLIAKDLTHARDRQLALDAFDTTELLAICHRAAAIFETAELPLGDTGQTTDDYLAQLTATTGLPRTLARRNMQKLIGVLADMATVFGGLTRGLDPAILDRGFGEQSERRLSYQRRANTLAAILPSNSPGVHGLWLPAIALKVPLALRPGQREPWTPWRLAQALLAAGCPPQGLSLYPSGHDGAIQLLQRADRSLLFGDGPTVEPWRHDPRIQLHGPGRSKVLIGHGEDATRPEVLDMMVGSIASNSGRSCLNASSVRVSSDGRAVGEALAARLAKIRPLPLDHPEAELAAFADPAVAKAIAAYLEAQLAIPGAVDLSAAHRDGGPLVEQDGCAFLLPMVVWCEDPDHPLANSEMLFPFTSVVETKADAMLSHIGPTLVATAVGDDDKFLRDVLACRDIDRLNLGLIPTQQIAWDQPHEGNLFGHLYQQRALQLVSASEDDLASIELTAPTPR